MRRTNPVIGICGHTKRGQRAHKLAEQVNAEMVAVDLGDVGAANNHRTCWLWLRESMTDWGVVLEDDAIPVTRFRQSLVAALGSSPSGLVSLYMGRNRPPHWQDSYGQALATRHHYLLAPELLHAVGYAIHRDHLDAVLEATDGTRHFNEAVSDWCRASGQQVAYTNPSLVDHDYRLPSLIDTQPTRYDENAPGSVPRNFTPKGWERRAWVVGPRTEWDRTSVAVIPEPGFRLRVTHRAACTVCDLRSSGSREDCEEWADQHVDTRNDHVVTITRKDAR